jgi:hypothetical protein
MAHGTAGKIRAGLLYTKPSTTTPARAWAGRPSPGRGSSASQSPVVFHPYPPWVVGAGSVGVSSWPQICRWDRRRCCWRISGPPGGPETRWILSVGWCPSKRVVVMHYARPYTAQKVSGGCIRAISGSASKFAEDTAYESSSSSTVSHCTSCLSQSRRDKGSHWFSALGPNAS